jgi:hypothetical protein
VFKARTGAGMSAAMGALEKPTAGALVFVDTACGPRDVTMAAMLEPCHMYVYMYGYEHAK